MDRCNIYQAIASLTLSQEDDSENLSVGRYDLLECQGSVGNYEWQSR
jgi:hypothetical protein